MRFLEKTVTLGEMTFKVATDRDIAVKAFEAYPQLIEYMFKKQDSITNDKDFFMEAIKNKELSKVFEMEKMFADLIEFALPLMLRKAGDKTSAKKIIDYATENGADTEMNSALMEFLCEGFTQRELAEPKIKFSMK